MLTGFEALGAASAVLQVISFAGEVVSVCRKVYDGRPTSNDDLEEHVKGMSDAVGRIQDRCQAMANTQQSGYDKKLGSIAEGCKTAATELEKEVRFVTSMHGKGSLLKAIHATIRASSHRKKIESLELSLFRYKQVMEVEIMSHLYNFKNLTKDVQSLVAQIAQGHTKLEGLVRAEHDVTREVVAQETVKTQKAINTHVTTEVQALGTNALTEAQRNSFLQSLKFPEMNQRYNDLMNSREASFKRVFASYEEMTSPRNPSQVTQDTDKAYFRKYRHEKKEADRAWAEFIEWLQSSDSLFCIGGKPGSGKSTLVKFIIDNKNTTQLLLRWSQTATIISHFFWKIGSSPQNSIKGLLCSLVYRTLHGNQDMIDHTLHRFHHLSSNTTYHDWSMEDLETVLFFVLEKDTRHLCIFVDGLDEICNKDGLFKLTQSIEKILKFPNVKMCVSSRPETLVMNWLEKKNVRGVLLEWLTRPEMVTFVHKELEPFLSNKTISSETYEILSHELVWKAQGVFLWLHLATRSLVTGIQNEDSKEMLCARLYVNMWQRLNENNSIYRYTAARIFGYTLQSLYPISVFPEDGSHSESTRFQQPTLFQIACAESIETQDILLTGTSSLDFTEVQRLCEKTKLDIQNRCAGLLRIESPRKGGRLLKLVGKADGLDLPEGTEDVNDGLFSRLVFIHRTAHDFLTDTEAGQDVLKCGMLSENEVIIRLLKGLLCLLRFIRSKYGKLAHPNDILHFLIRLSKTPANEGLEEATEMLQIVQSLYNNGVIGARRLSWQLRDPFFSLLTNYAQFDDFIISSLAQTDPSVLATEVLREAWDPDFSLSGGNTKGPSAKLVEALISMGADPHAYAVNQKQSTDLMVPFARQGTAFTNLLMCGILSEYDSGSYKDLSGDRAREMLKAMVSMATICPDLSATTLAMGYINESGQILLVNLAWLNELARPSECKYLLLLYEVDMKCLLLRLLSMLAVKIDEDNFDGSQVNELLPRLEHPSAKLRFIIARNGESKTPVCHRVSAELSTPKITEHLFAPATDLRKKSHQVRAPEKIGSAYEDFMHLTKDPSVETVDLESAVISLADERLGFCTLLEAGIIPTLPVRYIIR
ncbi:hypothetical protein BGZ61DRAFT_509602 [Ilyonectria robusta]|uniref:uncharacterized protein n=1 Tax=Ilyonectria robusta TaxID=1079257 RepID=UPI001E8DB7D5|nr:uncharacterized protein BGZ61DRAFT_509602 [Ilyonectria robusta]KAH8667143.1 hypothetical protein BGZ61DRAFT_509602 [Ilyonectria robusta]